jgi:DNA-binding transcriptional MerR regulator/effector-binding domain-containing protein
MLRIGDFARLGRVTVKALRHYEEEGLLAPREVDRATGYRYYAPEQLEALSWIVLLKDFGFRLDEVRRLLADPAALPDALARRRAALASAIDAESRRLQRLDAFQRMLDGEPPPPVTLRALEPQLAYTLRDRASLESGRITAMFEAAERRARKSRADASPFLLFHEVGDWADQLDVEVCVPVADAIDGARVVPGCAAAGALVYRGPYEQTPSLAGALAAWLTGSGDEITGPIREVYHRFGADQAGYRLPPRVLARSVEDYVTELQVPVA